MKKNYQLLFILTSYNVYKEHPVIDCARKMSGTDEQIIPTIKHVKASVG